MSEPSILSKKTENQTVPALLVVIATLNEIDKPAHSGAQDSRMDPRFEDPGDRR